MNAMDGAAERREREHAELEDALREKNHALAAALRRASEQIATLKDQLDHLATPPETYALFLRLESCRVDDDGVTRAAAEVLNGPRRMIVRVAPGVNVRRLAPGQEVLLNESLVLVAARDMPVVGMVRKLVRVPDARRLVVADQAGQEQVVLRASGLVDEALEPGGRVMVDAGGVIAIAALADDEADEMVLEQVPDVTFDDIGGLDEQIEQVRDAVELPFLHRGLFDRYGLKAPRGVLLYGPPGNGKTLIAKAVAHALMERVSARRADDGGARVEGVFISVKGPELLNKYVGESERLVRSMFRRARDKAASGSPVIVFIDEMDSLLRTRGTGVSSDVETTIVPQFLAELDGIEAMDNVIVIGASNRIDMIDPAVLRPGRLDVKVRIGRPGRGQAAAILRHYLTDDLPYAAGADADTLVDAIVGSVFAPGDARHVCDIRDEGGQWHQVRFADLISGAALKNIVDRAKKKAVKSAIEHGAAGIGADEALRAVDEEYDETVASVGGLTPSQWSHVTGLDDAGTVVGVRPAAHRTEEQA